MAQEIMSQDKTQKLKIEVYGRVQGVSFRYNVKKFAESNGIKGYVMNREDGSVEIAVQCNADKLKQFIAFLKGNPGFSKIEDIRLSELKTTKKFTDFKIEREVNYFSDKLKGGLNLTRRLFG